MTGKRGVMRLKKLIMKLTRCLAALQRIRRIASHEGLAALVPEGHFAVLAGKGDEEKEEKKRFVLELKYLKSPALLKLLKEAEEEYGFYQQGALVVPCRPEELRKIILEDKM